MKGKIQGIIGLLVIVFLVIGVIRSVYNRNFKSPDFKIIKSDKISVPIKNALFWYEQELEKTAFSLSNKLSAEEVSYVSPLFDALKEEKMVNEYIKTLSEIAVKEMIALDAYRGSEPNVIEIAKQQNFSYIFKIIITGASGKKSNDLTNVDYKYSIYDVKENKIIWLAESTRLSKFFGGMPESDKSISVLKKLLKDSKIIE